MRQPGQACWFAGQESPDKEADLWCLLTTLFHLCAVTGFAEWQLGPASAALLAEQLLALELQGPDGCFH